MSNKVLQSTTIVPPSLYVERSADRQVYKVIEEMGRPGYVLVARQMGKTNLLLNAKRKLETDSDLFVYIDLSNAYDTARERFRSFVDTTLEVGSDILGDLCSEIYKDRANSNLPAHIEHTRELRKILKKIRGKLVIILDEVDSLTKSDYSDEIFAQIRSVYFSRVNFSEANRLTYLLSGVAEPTELIKNTKISPFNIGEKIYLDDFSYEEFCNFIKLSRLPDDSLINDRIYYWTNGNPRMTWDVCSEIEDVYICNNNVTQETVDDIIYKLYFTNYDRPPVDHIRTLIEKERELRNAITEIRYNKADSVTDVVKNKLYLAGITNISSKDRQVVIKNKVIDLSLSKEYLESIDTAGKKAINIAQEMFINDNYKEAIRYYKICLDDSDISDRTREDIMFSIGSCYFKLSEHENTIDYLERLDLSKAKKTSQYYVANYYLGVSYSYLDNHKAAIEYYTNVVNGRIHDLTYFNALISLGSVTLRFNEEDFSTAENIYFRALIELEEYSSEFDKSEYANFLSVTNYNLAAAYFSNNNNELAEKYSIFALNLIDGYRKLKVYTLLLRLCVDDHAKYSSYSECILPILDSGLTVNISSHSYGLDFDLDGLMCLAFFSFIYKDETLHEKTLEIFKRSIDKEYNASEFYFGLASYASTIKRNNEAIELFKYIISSLLPELDLNIYHYAISKGLISSGLNDFYVGERHIFDVYIDTFGVCVNYEDCDVVDLKILSNILYNKMNQKHFDSNKILNISEKIIKSSNGKFDINYSLIYFTKMIISKEIGNEKDELMYAKRYIDIYQNKMKYDMSNSVIKKEDLDKIASVALSRISISSQHNNPYVSDKKFGRNDILTVEYDYGKKVTNKYKKLEEDIKKGKCKII